MSFEKAQQLMDLATYVAARRMGVRLDDVVEQFQVSRRTAQRMRHVLEAQFSDTNTAYDEHMAINDGCFRP
jgi:predicted DNA-binding transcriptional regulator YafY